MVNPIFSAPKITQPRIPAPAKGPRPTVGKLPTTKPAGTVGRNVGPRSPVFKTGAKVGAVVGAVVKSNQHPGPTIRHATPKTQKPAVDPIQGIIDRLLAPQLAQYGQQQRDLASRQQAQQTAWQQLTSELDARLQGIPGQIQGDYQNAIHTSGALGQQALQALTAANPNAQEQHDLQGIGAPQSQMDAQAAQNQAVFGGGGAVLNYLGGALPGQTLAQQELGKLFAARELPAIQGMSAKQALATLLAGQGKESSDLQSQIADARAKATSQAYTIQGQASSLAEKKREFAITTGLKGQALDLAYRKAQAGLAGYSKTITRADGSVVGVRKDGSTALLLPPGSVSQPYRGGSWSTKILKDGSVIQTNGKTGQVRSVSGANPAWATGSATTKPLTNAQLSKANQWLDTARKRGHYAHVDDPTKPITDKEIAAAAKNAKMTVSDFLGNSKAAQAARVAAGIGTVPVRQHDDTYIQNLYLALVRDFQVPPRQALSMVSKRFPTWGASHKDWFPNPNQAGGAGNTALKVGTYPVGIIKKYSTQYGLDPAAVLAYAMTQGQIGSVGDNGTSFGPFQAHIGGAAGNRTPVQAAAWANSEQGLAELMGMMARAGARGRRGPEAAAYIVGPAFGRGANPARDEANARAAYAKAYQMIYGTPA